MGKVGRFACIFVPMALTIASLVCLVFVFLGQTNKNSSTLANLYFFKADISSVTQNVSIPQIPGTDIDDKIVKALENAKSKKDLADFYTIGLWNYCSGDKKDNTYTVTFCSDRQSSFVFDPVDVWGLNGTTATDLFPKEFNNAINLYKKVAKWMFAAYCIALGVTAGEIIVGIFAIFSRWGSFVTTIVSTASTILCIAAAATSTGLYATLVGSFDTVLHPYGINLWMGTQMLAVEWLAVAFSLGAGFFWLISVCCCSGKSEHYHKRGKRGMTAEKTPYTYEPVGGAHHGQSVPLRDMGAAPGYGGQGGAYEPFRGDHRV